MSTPDNESSNKGMPSVIANLARENTKLLETNRKRAIKKQTVEIAGQELNVSTPLSQSQIPRLKELHAALANTANGLGISIPPIDEKFFEEPTKTLLKFKFLLKKLPQDSESYEVCRELVIELLKATIRYNPTIPRTAQEVASMIEMKTYIASPLNVAEYKELARLAERYKKIRELLISLDSNYTLVKGILIQKDTAFSIHFDPFKALIEIQEIQKSLEEINSGIESVENGELRKYRVELQDELNRSLGRPEDRRTDWDRKQIKTYTKAIEFFDIELPSLLRQLEGLAKKVSARIMLDFLQEGENNSTNS